MAWTDEARAKSLATRRAHAQANKLKGMLKRASKVRTHRKKMPSVLAAEMERTPAKSGAKNPAGKRRTVDKPYEIWEGGGFEYRVLKKNQSPDKEKNNPYATWYVAAKSPYTGGSWEYGDSYVRDVKSGTRMSYQDPVLREKVVPGEGGYPAKADLTGYKKSAPKWSKEEAAASKKRLDELSERMSGQMSFSFTSNLEAGAKKNITDRFGDDSDTLNMLKLYKTTGNYGHYISTLGRKPFSFQEGVVESEARLAIEHQANRVGDTFDSYVGGDQDVSISDIAVELDLLERAMEGKVVTTQARAVMDYLNGALEELRDMRLAAIKAGKAK